MLEAPLIIDGKRIEAADAATFDRCNPISGNVVTRAAAGSSLDAEKVVRAAAAAFPTWAASGPNYRRTLLLRAEQLLLERVSHFESAMALELGATAGWAHFNVQLAAGMLREAAAMTTQVAGQVIPSDVPGMLALTQRRPAGVVLGIAPWNAPVILGVRAIAMPLSCGNTVILKGSELCPATHGLIISALVDAGFPAGTVNYMANAPQDASAVVGALIAHPAVRRINFTGSTAVGRLIAAKAAMHLKPVLLELGGKAPLIVLDDADLDGAVAAASFGAFMNSGQICMSTERVLVDQKIADEFVAKLAARAATLKAADPLHESAPLGALAVSGAPGKLAALIEDAIDKGATVALKGSSQGALVSPTVLDHVASGMRIYHEESFGPVASVIRFGDIEEALRIANDTEYGLAAAVFGRDVGRAMTVADQIKAGSRHVNMATIHDQPQIPFGGLNASGYGRFGGMESIFEFTDTCVLSVRSTPLPTPI